jgi:hypothetical protein
MSITIDGTTGISGNNGSASTPAVQGEDTNTGIFFPAADTVAVATAGVQRVRVDSSGNVGIGTSSPTSIGTSVTTLDIEGSLGGAVRFERTGATASEGYLGAFSGEFRLASIGAIPVTFRTDNTERARITQTGDFLVGKATADASLTGVEARSDGFFIVTRDLPTAGSDRVCIFDRLTSTGEVIALRKDGTTVGVIGVGASNPYIGSGDVTLVFSASGDAIVPTGTDGATRSGAIDLGNSANRWDTVYAAVGTINTSDRTEKQDIEELNDAERRVAVACKGLLRKYRLKSAVALKGEDARIHFGIIAQDLQAAFEAEGLDAGRYGMFINSTWTDEETGEERSLMGVRYSELLAFMIAVL